ncbi:hypothetical protein ACC696_38710, partial [Rhizobium ruizarguesonis]
MILPSSTLTDSSRPSSASFPEALSDFDGPYRHQWEPADKYATITTGWKAPPTDLKKWGDLIEA